MKIVVLDGYTENPGDLSWADLEKLGELTVYDRTSLSNVSEVIQRIGDAEAVYTNKTPMPKEVFESCTKLKFVGVLATGYNVVDVEAARMHDVVVSNIPTYGTSAVAQFAAALLLEICHHVGHHANEVKKGSWSNNQDWCFWDFPLIELAGKTVGIIGFGRIGQAAGQLFKAFGMKVLAYDQFPNDSGREIGEYVSFDEILSQSDVISLHCPLFPSTEGIINRNNISKMKDGVIILNTSRGPLVVEDDLAEALRTGKVFAAGVDVVSTEPIREDNPLLKEKNCLITPHIAWAPKESRQRLMDIAVENLSAFKKGNPINVVNA